ncbi:MAG: hypothetical protein JNL32_16085, partial [Candidatus Kapabacteria bacterium]|nr:hypothetical protein [Candidatus Kapabacteria bacterium]
MKHAENNLRGKHVLVAILTGAIMIAGTFTTSFAQAGNRLYLRFDDNATTNARGIRIKPSEGNDYYWVFGDVNPITGNGVAKVQPGCIRINHRHYSSNAALTAITNVSDFVTNGTDITVAAHRWSRQFSSPPAFLDQAMPLTRLDQNINLITGNSDDYPLNTRFMHPGAKIVRNGGDYITAFNCYDLTGDTTAGGGNLMDWGMAKINATTMAVTWSFAFAHINPNNTAMRYHEDVRDVLSVAGNAYVACGAKRNFGTMQFGGIVAKVDNNGALLWYREYYAPGGARIYFTCISEVLIPNGTEYIVSGSYSLNNQPGTRDGIITAGLDPATGAVIWCYVWTPPVPYTAVVPSGGMQSGFRHVNMPDRGIVVCAIVQNQNT